MLCETRTTHAINALRCFDCLRKADGGKHVSDCGECNAFERFTKDIVEVVRVVVEGGEEDKELGKAERICCTGRVK